MVLVFRISSPPLPTYNHPLRSSLHEHTFAATRSPIPEGSSLPIFFSAIGRKFFDAIYAHVLGPRQLLSLRRTTTLQRHLPLS